MVKCLTSKAAPTGLQCSSIQARGETEPTSEVIWAYPENRPDSSSENMRVTGPAYNVRYIWNRWRYLASLAEDLNILYRNSPATLPLMSFPLGLLRSLLI